MIPTVAEIDAEFAERGLYLNGDGTCHRLTKDRHAEHTKGGTIFDDEEPGPVPEIVQVAEKLEPRMVRLLATNVDAIKRALDTEQLKAWILAGDVAALEDATSLSVEFENQLTAMVAADFLIGAEIGMTTAQPHEQKADLGTLGGVFDLVNPEAIVYGKQRGSALISDMSNDQRRIVRGLVARSVGAEYTIDELVVQLRSTVGLIKQDYPLARPLAGSESLVSDYRRQLIAEGFEGEALEQKYNRFVEKNLRYRHRNIARTEVLAAENAGQQALWSEAHNTGLLPQNVQRSWIVTWDQRLCPYCAPMEGQTRNITESFAPGVMQPPLHPSCRCTLGLVFPKGE